MRQSNLFKHRVLLGAAVLMASLGSTGALADLDDPAIYDLTDPSAYPSGNDFVLVCGTTVCGAGPSSEIPSDADGRTVPDPDDSGYAIFSVYEVGPTGSGYINPFLRFQHNEQDGNGSDTIETAYNTDDTLLQSFADSPYNYQNQAKDTVAGGERDGDFNRAILYDEMLADEDGYFTFLLDINEPEGGDFSTLRLDELSFFISDTNSLSEYNPDCNDTSTAQIFGSAGCFEDDAPDTQKVWDMDLDPIIGAINLDNVNSGTAGSGDYDLMVKLPSYVFDEYVAMHADTSGLYIYLENTAGAADGDATDVDGFSGVDMTGGEAQAGFEEWAFIAQREPTQVPVPGTLFLTGIGLLLLGRRMRR